MDFASDKSSPRQIWQGIIQPKHEKLENGIKFDSLHLLPPLKVFTF